MAVDLTALRTFVGASNGDDEELTACVLVGTAMVDEYITDVPTDDAVPPGVLDRAYLLVAAEVFHQGRAPNGVLNQQFEDGGSTPFRVSADPLRPVYPLLRLWVDPVTFA